MGDETGAHPTVTNADAKNQARNSTATAAGQRQDHEAAGRRAEQRRDRGAGRPCCRTGASGGTAGTGHDGQQQGRRNRTARRRDGAAAEGRSRPT